MKTLNTLIASALVVAAGATAASASNIYTSNIDASSDSFSIGTVVADSDAKLVVYNYHGGQRGEVLDTVDVHAGVNFDVDLDANTDFYTVVKAELVIDGVAVESEVFHFDN